MSSLGHDVVHRLEPGIDVILMIDPRPDQGHDDINYLYGYKTQNPNCKLVHRINDTDVARGTDFLDKIIIQSNKIAADYTVFISNWVKEYYSGKGLETSEKSCKVIVNGCENKWYFPGKEKVLSDKIRLITHHWSDNFMKGFDVYNYLDKLCEERKDIEFTYLGRYNNQYTPTNTNVIPPKYGPEVGDILRAHDIYVTASRWEACGSHHIEGSSCGLPILYHKDGGAIPEICKNHGYEFHDPRTFESALDKMIENYFELREKIDYRHLSIDRCLKEYYGVLVHIIDS
jgi:hypothetical protein